MDFAVLDWNWLLIKIIIDYPISRYKEWSTASDMQNNVKNEKVHKFYRLDLKMGGAHVVG